MFIFLINAKTQIPNSKIGHAIKLEFGICVLAFYSLATVNNSLFSLAV